MAVKLGDARWRNVLTRLEDAYDWVSEWIGDVGDTKLALVAFALAGVSIFYALMR